MKRVTSLPSFSNTADSSGGGVGKVRPRRGWLGSIMKTVDEEEVREGGEGRKRPMMEIYPIIMPFYDM